ncbi:hypothetical protein ACFQUU_17745 [Herbaspirillum sp. GCM10030257]|uniref:hypothetical protein n=1 Tax=Herbaspirillum sp. GCM10030257 TaxID=3273393 RepID=UPI0036113710
MKLKSGVNLIRPRAWPERLELMADGLVKREIVCTLGIASHTAKFHVAQIFVTTGSATRRALQMGLIGL